VVLGGTILVLALRLRRRKDERSAR
jgi:hypothetical protein